jgi:hypothetical protein
MAQSNAVRRRESDAGRERAAQLRIEQRHRERHRRLLLVLGSAVGVLAVLAVIVVVGVTSGKSTSTGSSAPRSTAPAAVVASVTGVSAATLDAVGQGSSTSVLKAVSDPPLTSSGKRVVFYVGAEFCPYCAASRWALVQALSRFGNFKDLSLTTSSSTDAFPDTASFTFHGSTYASDTIVFNGRELETRTGAPLDSIPASEASLWHRYTGQSGSFPFLYIAGRYVEIGQSVNPAVLKGLTAEEIASRLNNPSDPVAQAVDGTANVLTAAICSVTANAPVAVCSATGVVAAGKALGG